jgi:hypothetical protein
MRAAKILKHSSTAFPQTALGKRGSPIGEQLQPELGISRAKHVLSNVEGTQRVQRSEKKRENHS